MLRRSALNTFLIATLFHSPSWAEVWVDHSSGAGKVSNVANAPLAFGTNNTERVRILSSGNVGIGTLTPQVKLDVNGLVRSAFGGVRLPDGSTLTTAMTASTGNTSTTDLTYNADNDTNGSGAFIFNTAGVEKMRILNGGNMGIGTAAPVTLLDASSTTGSVLTLSRESKDVSAGALVGKIQFWNNDTQLTTQNIYATIEVDAALDVDTNAAAGVITFNTTSSTAGSSPVERMRIDENGYVGIGTTTPVALFIVKSADPQTIAGGGTITADACGTIKKISSAGNVTTSTTNTFTAPVATLDGCCMDVVNAGANQVTLDSNTNFYSNGAANINLGARDAIRVCSDGVRWYQITPRANN